MKLPPLPEPTYPQWSHSNEFEAFTGAQMEWYAEQVVAAAIKQVEAERDALREDAERYRWLKDKCVVNTTDFGDLGIKFDCDLEHWDNVDAAIDTARREA